MSRYRLFYHFVWATKNRLPLITEGNRAPLYAEMVAKAAGLGGIVHALNGMPDHMHLVATVPPKVSLSKFMAEVKGASSHLATHLHTPYSDQSFKWQESYGVLSVSESHLSYVVSYVENQQQHHAEGGELDDRLEAME
jgi:REP element-mobilizing transposase RayT